MKVENSNEIQDDTKMDSLKHKNSVFNWNAINPQQKNFLPDFCSLKMLLVVLFLTELLAFVLTLAATETEFDFLAEFALRSLLALWIALPSVAVLCGLKKPLQDLNNTLVGVLVFAIIQLICVLMSWLAVTVLPQLQLLIPFVADHEKIPFYARTLGISAVMAIAFLRYLYVLFQWQQQIEAKAMAKLYALQARMRPHFLFNSLNSIASLTRVNPELAEKLVEDLAELIRASMTMDENLLVPLEQEINLVELYLAIETQRLDERLTVRWALDEVPKDALIPPLSLQPLVENAVYYGIEPNPNGGEVFITGYLRFNRVLISVINPQVSQSIRSRPSNQIALKNLADRLGGCFEGDGVLKIDSDDNTYQVTLDIPYQT
jgi:two-component system sensor histidine kinase AlgZ